MTTATERAQAHYTRWLQLGTGAAKRIQWNDRGIAFRVENPYLTPDGKGIGVTITVSDANGPLPVDNPYQFFNPPLGIVTGYYGDGTPVIDTSEVIAVAKAMVYDAVTLRARQLGWTP